MKIGILALQGAVREHCKALHKLGCEAVKILSPQDLSEISGLILPGGESTAVSRLLVKCGLLSPIIELGRKKLPIFGTCTGLILLSKHIVGNEQEHCLGLMDTYVKRNAFGRQLASFETEMLIPILGSTPYHTIFIRAPYIDKVGKEVRILLSYENKILFAEQNNLLAVAFHPELTEDTRIHEYFIQKIINSKVPLNNS